jgi:hypothetical protein
MVIEYLLEENRVLKEQFDKTGKKLRLTNLLVTTRADSTTLLLRHFRTFGAPSVQNPLWKTGNRATHALRCRASQGTAFQAMAW